MEATNNASPEKQKVMSKSKIYSEVAARTGLTAAQVKGVTDELTELIRTELNGEAGAFVLPGLVKITVTQKPATEGGEKPNPWKKGEMMVVKAKPAKKIVKLRPLADLKRMV